MILRSRQLYSDPLTDYMTGYVDHLILGAASYQTDYQVLIRIYRGYVQNTGNAIYIPPSECRPDFSDIRFADTAGRLLPYWIETTGTDYADIWVKLYQIPTTGAVVRVLFGGGAIPSAPNSSTTFQFYDDFLGSALDATKWTNPTHTGTVSVSSGVITLVTSNASGEEIRSISTFGTNTAIRMSAGMTKNAASGTYSYFGYHNGTQYVDAQIISNTGVFLRNNNGSANNAAITCATDYSLNLYDIARNGTTDTRYYENGASAATNSSNVPTGALNLSFGAIPNSGTTEGVKCDWILVRSYTYPEPSHGWWGPLEDL